MIGGDIIEKYEKELLQRQLDREKAVLSQLKREYQQALEDINLRIKILQSDEMTISRIHHLNYQQTLKKQIEAILEKLLSDEYTTIEQFLSESYIEGFVKTEYLLYNQDIPIITPIDQEAVVHAIETETKLSESLYDTLGVDVAHMKKAVTSEITRGISTGLTYNEIARNISNATKAPYARAKTIARTEAGRVQERGTMDAAKKALAKGADIAKKWSAVLDGKTRPSHRELDGQIREIDEPFTVGGKKAMNPHDFNDPSEDCNCRCTTIIKARTMLTDGPVARRDNFTGELLEFNSVKDYEDFKKRFFSEENIKYMNYVEALEDKYHTKDFGDMLGKISDKEHLRLKQLKNASPIWKG